MWITKLSHSTRVSVSSDWVILGDVEVDNGTPLEWRGTNWPSRYSKQVRKIVRETIPPIWEKLAVDYLWGRVVPDSESSLYDVILDDWTFVEVKTSRIWSTACIREWQLNRLWIKDLFALVYFETQNNRSQPPSFHVHRCIEENFKTPPAEYLKRKVRVKTMLIIPKPTIVNFFNKSKLRLLRNSSGLPYKALCRSRAVELFDKNPDGFDTTSWGYKYGRHEIEVFHMWSNFK